MAGRKGAHWHSVADPRVPIAEASALVPTGLGRSGTPRAGTASPAHGPLTPPGCEENCRTNQGCHLHQG